MNKTRRAISIKELYSTNFRVLPFGGKWKGLIGSPELTGSWIIWGDSGNGKTRLALQLCKYLTKFEKVVYNALEEGASESLKQALMATSMEEVEGRFMLLDNEPLNELKTRLKRPKSPRIVVIDSLQYLGISYREYKNLREEFPGHLFILISHADGKHPDGRVAKSIRYDAFVKIFCQGYKAFATSRYGGGTPYVIWKQGAAQYYGADNG